MPTEKRGRDIHIGLSFWIEIQGIEVAGFSECSGLSIETETMEYAEGGWNYYTHKLPVRTKYSNVTLRRGIDPGQDLHSWYVSTMNGATKRKNITIKIYGPDGKVAKEWSLRDAYPVKWSGPDLKTDAGATAIETLEFAHNGLIAMPTRV